MPALPTITVTDAQANRMLAAFGSTDAYLTWLRKNIIDYVVDSEYEQDYKNFVDSANARRDAARADLL